MLDDKAVPNERMGKVGAYINMDLQADTGKQLQMHMTTKIIAEKLTAKAKNLKVFTRRFLYDISYFAILGNEPSTVERFPDGEFTKYLNNNGNLCQKILGKSFLFKQAEALVHFPMKQATKSFCLLICKGQITNYAIQR